MGLKGKRNRGSLYYNRSRSYTIVDFIKLPTASPTGHRRFSPPLSLFLCLSDRRWEEWERWTAHKYLASSNIPARATSLLVRPGNNASIEKVEWPSLGSCGSPERGGGGGWSKWRRVATGARADLGRVRGQDDARPEDDTSWRKTLAG